MDKAIPVLVVAVLLSLSASCGYMRWNECRRIHPWWYCASNGGR